MARRTTQFAFKIRSGSRALWWALPVLLCLQVAMAKAQQPTVLQDPWLLGAGSDAYDIRYPADSTIQVLEPRVAAQASDKGREAVVLRCALAIAYSTDGQFSRSAMLLLDAMPVLQRMQDEAGLGFVNQWLAYDYKMMDQYVVAERYARMAVTHMRASGVDTYLCDALNALGNCLMKQEKFDSAVRYYEESARTAGGANYLYGIARARNNLGNIWKARGNFERARMQYQAAIEISRRISEVPPVFFLNNLGGCYLALGKPDSALYFSQSALDSAGPQPDRDFVINTLGNLARAHAARGEFERAYHLKDTLLKLNLDMLNADNFALLSETEAKYENEAKRQEIALLKTKNALQDIEIDVARDRRNILIATVITLLVIALLGWLAYRNKRESSKLLAEQKARIELMNALLEDKVRERTEALSQVNAELDELLYRSSHDLRTPITKLTGLLNLLEIEDDPEQIRKFLGLLGTSVHELDKLNLSICEAGTIRMHQPSLEEIDIAALIQSVLAVMPRANLQLARLSTERLSITADPWLLRLALQEILANASDTRPEGTVRISIECGTTAQHHFLTITDDGPGVPPILQDRLFHLFSRGSNLPGHHGLGLYKARLALQKMQGDVTLTHASVAGSTFEITLPLPTFAAN